MRNDRLIRIDHGVAAGLDRLFLRERQQRVQELVVDLQHLDEFHQAAVRDVELAVEPVCPRVRLDANVANRRQVDRTGQFRDVLRLWIGRRKGADADSVLLGEHDPMHEHVFVPAVIDVLEVVPALRAQFAFDVDAVMLLDLGAQLGRDQVQRLLTHRTVLDGVDGSLVVARPVLEPALEHRDDGRLAAADRAHDQENALADLEPLGGGLEVLDDPVDGFLDSVKLIGKELVATDLVRSTLVDLFDAGREHHVADARVRQLRVARLLRDELEVVAERAFPGEAFAVSPVRLEHVDQIRSFLVRHVIHLLLAGDHSATNHLGIRRAPLRPSTFRHRGGPTSVSSGQLKAICRYNEERVGNHWQKLPQAPELQCCSEYSTRSMGPTLNAEPIAQAIGVTVG